MGLLDGGMNAKLESISHNARCTGYSMAMTDLAEWARAEVNGGKTHFIDATEVLAFIRRSLEGRDERVRIEP